MTDEQAEAICIMIRNGYGKAFPLNENGEQIGWYDWLRSKLIGAPDLLAENERLQDLYRRTLSALKDIAVSGDDGTQEQHAPEMWAYCRERARTTVAFAHQDDADKAAATEGLLEPEETK